MYLWDEIEYKVNYIQFISNETVTEQQMQVASATVNNWKSQFTITEEGSKRDPDHCGNAMIINLSQYSGR